MLIACLVILIIDMQIDFTDYDVMIIQLLESLT